MTGKKRFLKAINHEEPDCVPVFANLSPPVAEKIGKKLGIKCEKVESSNLLWAGRISYTEILAELGNDAIGIGATRDMEKTYQLNSDGTITDEWGFRFASVSGYSEIVGRPLEGITDVKEVLEYDIPDPLSENRWQLAREMIGRYGDNYAVIGFMGQTMFEMCWNLIGFESFLMDFFTEEEYLMALLDRLMEYAVKYSGKLIDLGVDVIFMGDDVGTQNGMLVSPELWRKIMKPRMKKICGSIKNKKPDVKIAYHSCGSIFPIIGDLIETGIDILNPIQPLAKDMDLKALKEMYGDRLCFFGGIDVQQSLPHGSAEDIEKEVRDRILSAARGGGFIIAPAHIIQSDTRVENVEAFFNAVKRYGRYPINF